MLPEATLKYRLDFGMTADAEGHVNKVMRAVAKAKDLGHISEKEFKLYEVRKAYELARTYKKRGNTEAQKKWKSEALNNGENYASTSRSLVAITCERLTNTSFQRSKKRRGNRSILVSNRHVRVQAVQVQK